MEIRTEKDSQIADYYIQMQHTTFDCLPYVTSIIVIYTMLIECDL